MAFLLSNTQPNGLQIGRLPARDRKIERLRRVMLPENFAARGAYRGCDLSQEVVRRQFGALVEANKTPEAVSSGTAAVTSSPKSFST